MQGRHCTSPRVNLFVRDGCSAPRVARLQDARFSRPGAGPPPGRQPDGFLRRAFAARGRDHGVEYLIRQARITDIDRLAAISRASMPGSGGGSLDAADLLRQLVYLPNASLLVAEARREIA